MKNRENETKSVRSGDDISDADCAHVVKAWSRKSLETLKNIQDVGEDTSDSPEDNIEEMRLWQAN